MNASRSFREWKEAEARAQDMQERVFSIVSAGRRLPDCMFDDLVQLRLAASVKLREMLIAMQVAEPVFENRPAVQIRGV